MQTSRSSDIRRLVEALAMMAEEARRGPGQAAVSTLPTPRFYQYRYGCNSCKNCNTGILWSICIYILVQ